ncbi:MAG: Rieske (2Fe-2S) protein [Anaerolineales bacterium]|nr:Rieske (2Fe-2S) protein [Anaerolineales bacterium]
MKWVRTISEQQLKTRLRYVARIEGMMIQIVYYQDEIFAFDNKCPHWGYPLTNGRIGKDHSLTCPFHRSAFDFSTGDVTEWSPWPPGFGNLLRTIRRKDVLPIFQTKVENGYIYVDMAS